MLSDKAAAASVPGIYDSPDLTLEDQKLNYKQAWQFATILSKAECTPQAWRGKTNDCFVAVTLALQMQLNPFIFMQHAYPVNGKIRIEGKMVKTLIDMRGPYPEGLKISEPTGAGDNRAVTVSGIRRSGEIDSLTFSYGQARAAGWVDKAASWWPKLPDQMLAYRAVSLFCDRYCPHVRMGLQTIEEAQDIDATTQVVGRGRRTKTELTAAIKKDKPALTLGGQA